MDSLNWIRFQPSQPEPVQSGNKTMVHPPQVARLEPQDYIGSFGVRPGLYERNGATPLPNGVNFTICSCGATAVQLLLFHRGASEPFAILPFPPHYRMGHVYSMIVFHLDIHDLEYAYRVDGPYAPQQGLLFDPSKCLLDPYAKAVAGQSHWGVHTPAHQRYRARVVLDDFDWGNISHPLTPMEDLIIYELHVRGFTNHPSSGVQHPGTFAGLMEKLPYLEELGVNAIELMPIFEFDEMLDCREVNGETLYNYWGYNTLSFFAPNTSYSAASERNREGTELKRLIKACKQRGIEVYLDVVFNHTAEGNGNGPFFSFKGLDNNIYYLLTPDGKYHNFSGCGNTMNCNHPIVRQMILDCLRYWVTTYQVDGFRFDLASILGRGEDGAPMASPPLLQSLALDPILADVKLIAEAWDAAGLYQVGTFPAWGRWAEWNGRYRDDMRRYLRGDNGMAQAAALRLTGSQDIYGPANRSNASVNFFTCHDGFTLRDLFSYHEKHNQRNGWNNTDGANDNYSWNCGAEGETGDPAINALRRRMARNAFVLLMCSRGTPMFLAGDEFGNTQFGNNNAYCLDDATSWLDWSLLEQNKGLFRFVQYMIRLRKTHPILRSNLSDGALNFPDTSFHGVTPFKDRFESQDHYIGVLFAGHTEHSGSQAIYVASNAYWEPLTITLPPIPATTAWERVVDTWDEEQRPTHMEGCQLVIRPRTVMVFVAR